MYPVTTIGNAYAPPSFRRPLGALEIPESQQMTIAGSSLSFGAIAIALVLAGVLVGRFTKR